MYMDDDTFFQWFNAEATAEDRALMERVEDFGEYFEDMLFKKGTASYALTTVPTKEKNESEIAMGWGLPDELEYFDYTWIRYKAVSREGCDGSYDSENGILMVPPEGADATVLHEMIHLHETLINSQPFYWHDMLYWVLYQDLRKKIPQLDEIITKNAHMLTEAQISEMGGVHDILFMLKSFDLDIRMGYPLGTVFGYGRADELKGYGYITELNP